MAFSLKYKLHHFLVFNVYEEWYIFENQEAAQPTEGLLSVFCNTKYNAFPEVYPCNSIMDVTRKF